MADRRRLEELARWLKNHRSKEPLARWRVNDVKFDLTYEKYDGGPRPEYGGDFLKDGRLFDVVVLHHIFAGWDNDDPATRPSIGHHPCFETSTMQSPEAWRRRLQTCGAALIIAFGGRLEVAGAYLGTIRGYSRVLTTFGAVYRRSIES